VVVLLLVQQFPERTAILIEIKEHDLQTCSSKLFRTNFKAANSAAFL
jgi:hypothetical protein